MYPIKNGTTYFARDINYTHKMFMKSTTGQLTSFFAPPLSVNYRLVKFYGMSTHFDDVT